MPLDFVMSKERRSITRVIRVGRALYINLPKAVVEMAGLKIGDRLVMETDGRILYSARIPFEELLGQRRRVVLKKERIDRAENAEMKRIE